MNKTEAILFLEEMYRDIVENLNIDKIPDYFAGNYMQTTDGVTSDLVAFRNHIAELKRIAGQIRVSPFHDIVFDQEEQMAAVRYEVDVTKKHGARGQVELLALFQWADSKIVRCHELSRPVSSGEEFKDIASVNARP
ncbi:nuclear transport factor 2 family protein [Paenibacillus sanfengchensis]